MRRPVKVKIRYLVEKPGRDAPRYFWQPSRDLAAAGWRPLRLADDRRQAIAEAEARNKEVDAWRQAGAPTEGGAAPPAPIATVDHGSLAWVIRRYKASRFWAKLAPKTRRGYDQNIKVLELWAGPRAVVSLTPKRWEALYSAWRVRTPAKARALVIMGQILMKAAIREELITHNPCAEMGLEGSAPSGRIWPRAAVDAFVAAADAAGWHSVGTAVRINHWIGQREGDVLALKPGQWRDGSFTVAQSKGRKRNVRVRVPANAEVAARVEAELERLRQRRLAGTTLLLREDTGLPWDEHSFRHVFAEIRATLAAEQPGFPLGDGSEVATLGLQFMHLRHTAVTEHAIAGTTAPQIASITGHSPKTVEQILARYLVLTSELAKAATAKRIAWDNAREGGG